MIRRIPAAWIPLLKEEHLRVGIDFSVMGLIQMILKRQDRASMCPYNEISLTMIMLLMEQLASRDAIAQGGAHGGW